MLRQPFTLRHTARAAPSTPSVSSNTLTTPARARPRPRPRALLLLLLLALLAPAFALSARAGPGDPSLSPSFITFESGPVRPLALTPDGAFLAVTNIPDGRLELFQVLADGSLAHARSIPVGLEPVAVAARSNSEVWVVNHLSDSVSVVDLSQGRVTRTLLVGDEPRDIVFAGANRERAFITTAHRGRHRTDPSLAGVPGAGDPQLTTPGVGRADVWVFDAANPGGAVGGVPLKIITLFGDTPRPLAVTPDGATVYAAVFHSGNQTTVVSELATCDGFEDAGPCLGDGRTMPGGLPGGLMPGGNPGPSTNYAGEQAPEVGLIVRYNNETEIWEDELGRNWNNAVRFTLPDYDVFAIDAATLTETVSYAHVGTTLFNLAVNPATGRLYVSNTEMRNEVRFEGPGDFGGSTVQGDLARARITVIDPATASVQPRHLNKHIDYSIRPAPPGTKAHSLSTPLQMVVSGDGQTLYVAAFGSSKVGVFQTATLEDDSFDPTVQSAQYIPVSGGGPAGLLLNEGLGRLYVYTRFDNGLSIVDPATGELAHLTLFNPEPAVVVQGRPFLYDAQRTSSNGEASCASCHVFGDMDDLAWDLGNPDDDVTHNPIPINLAEQVDGSEPSPINGTGEVDDFHPMKGPMTTQTLRGLLNSGAMHWRGDRSNGFFGLDPTDAELSFNNFIVAFPGLVGAGFDINDPEQQEMMQQFTDFALEIILPPNPIRNLDRSLTPLQQIGSDFFSGERRSDGQAIDVGDEQDGFTCEGCHALDPAQGFFGTSTNSAFQGATQIFKIPHVRNVYQKIGKFGMYGLPFAGDQVRGFGFLHEGAFDTLMHFFQTPAFRERPGVGFDGGNLQRRGTEAFMFAFDSDLAPIVGQQVTLNATNWNDVRQRILLLVARAQTPFVSNILGGTVTECALVVQSAVGNQPLGWLYSPVSGRFRPDAAAGNELALSDFVALAASLDTQFTFTCVPPGSGRRIALDRDLDGLLNRDDPQTAITPESQITGIRR
ncbi:MAG: YncE family protein [Ardenticatenaceae bacterium]